MLFAVLLGLLAEPAGGGEGPRLARAVGVLKGRVLAAGVRPGMTRKEVDGILGPPSGEWPVHLNTEAVYGRLGVTVCFGPEPFEVAGEKRKHFRVVVREVEYTPLRGMFADLLK